MAHLIFLCSHTFYERLKIKKGFESSLQNAYIFDFSLLRKGVSSIFGFLSLLEVLKVAAVGMATRTLRKGSLQRCMGTQFKVQIGLGSLLIPIISSGSIWMTQSFLYESKLRWIFESIHWVGLDDLLVCPLFLTQIQPSANAPLHWTRHELMLLFLFFFSLKFISWLSLFSFYRISNPIFEPSYPKS